MKKFTLLLILILSSFTSFGQVFPECFEGSSTALPTNWAQYQAGAGLTQFWKITSIVSTPPFVCNGSNAAWVIPENIGINNTSEDYLVSPTFTVPTNGQVRFFSRQGFVGDQGTIYQLLVSTNPDGSVLADYVMVKEWTEDQMNTTFNICQEQKVSISAYANQSVHIALLRKVTQTTPAPAGDRWAVDCINVVEECLKPGIGTSSNIFAESATLSWLPAGAGTFDIEFITTGVQTGVPSLQNVSNPHTATGLQPSTTYQYYVRRDCDPGNNDTNTSDWNGPFTFQTLALGATCQGPISVITLPYQTTNNTGNFNDFVDVTQSGTQCGATPAATNYLTGNDVFYKYTADASGLISIKLTPTGPNASVFVYASCPVGGTCIAGLANANGNVRFINNIAVTAGTSYTIVISSGGTTQTVGYTLLIQKENCTPPVGVTPVTPVTETEATLTWSNPTGATKWEIDVKPLGAPIPTGVGIETLTNPYIATGLTPATQYQFYVRSECAPGIYSSWAGPYPFNTQVCSATSVSCTYDFIISASSGNTGWSGAKMEVRQNGIVVGTLGTGFTTGAGPITVPVSLCLNPPYATSFDLFWTTPGTQPARCKVIVKNSYGQTLFTKEAGQGAANTVLYSDTVKCDAPVCNIAPIAVTAPIATITNYTALVSWTSVATDTFGYEVLVLPAGSPAPNTSTPATYTPVASSPFTVTNLLADTTYDVYVRVICSPIPSPWSLPVTFTTPATCLKPTNQTIVAASTTINSAVLGWTNAEPATDNHWEVLLIANATPTPSLPPAPPINPVTSATTLLFDYQNAAGSITSSFTATGLTPATIYYYYVRTYCSNIDKSTWTGPFTFNTVTCDVVDKCNYKFFLTNTVGNNWNGARMQVRQNGIIITTLGATGINAAAGIVVPLCTNVPFDLFWNTAGTLPENVGISIQNPFLDVLYTKAAGVGLPDTILYSAVTNCSPAPCSKPTLMTAVPSATSAVLSWQDNSTPPASLYDLYVVLTGGAPPINDPASTPTHTGVLNNSVLTTFNGLPLVPSTSYTYYVRTDCGGGVHSTWTILTPTTFITEPLNDDCINATPITINPAQECLAANNAPGNTYGATASLATELPGTLTGTGCGATNKDVWYKFVATLPSVSISVNDVVPTPATATTLKLNYSVFSGDCNNLTLMYCNTTAKSGAVGLIPGNTYYIRVYTATNTAGQSATFNVCLTSPPVNDECVNAVPVTINANQTCNPINTVSGTTNSATASIAALTPPLTAAGCGQSNNDVWYKFVATAISETINISNVVPTPSTAATLKLNHSVFSGDCTNLVNLYCSTNYTSIASGLTIGNTYYIRIYTATNNPDQSATFDLCITSPPINDNCSNAASVTVNAGQACLPANNVSGNTFGATNSLALVGTTCGLADDDVWFKFVATSISATISINDIVATPTQATALKLNYAVFSGSCGTLTQLTCSTNGIDNVSGLVIGDTYYVNVYTPASTVGQSATFNICITSPPANDDCVNATNIIVNSDQTCLPANNAIGNTFGATQSNPVLTPALTGATCGPTSKDVWYKFTATSTSHAISLNNIIYTPNNITSLKLNFSVFSGDCNNLTKLYCSAANGINALNLTVGATYYIRVYTTNNTTAQSATFEICITSPPVNDNCINASTVTVNTGQVCDILNNVAGNTLGATASSPALNPVVTGAGCGTATSNDVWYKFVATNNSVSINLNDVVVTPIPATTVSLNYAVFSGDCNNLTKLYCATTANSNASGLIVGNTYYIRIYLPANIDGQSATFNLCISLPPPNDDCLNAIDVPVNLTYECTQTVTGNTLGATTSLPAVTGAGCGTTDDDMWYKFVATSPILFLNLDVISTTNSLVTLNYSVFSGNCTSLTKLYCSTTANSVASNLIVGDTYYVRVYTALSTAGSSAIFKLCIKTPPPPGTNNECANALPIIVNTNAVCTTTTAGNIIGATGSVFTDSAPTCTGNANDDVWFSFVAINATHSVALNDVEGSTLDLNFAIYSGTCGALTKELCSAAGSLRSYYQNYTPGQTYYVRVWSNSATTQYTTFNVCVKSESTCDTAQPACGVSGQQSLIFDNTTSTLPTPPSSQIACLFSSPNPTYFYLRVEQSGTLVYQINQSTSSTTFPTTGAPGLDVDFAAWGPFTSPAACNDIVFGPCSPAPCTNNVASGGTGVYPNGNVIDCSYSGNPQETLTINNAVAGQYYVLLLTNFNGAAGYIKLELINAGQAGAGDNTNLCCAVDLGPDEKACGSITLDAVENITEVTAIPSEFIWYFNGTIVPNVTTRYYTVSESGTYKVKGTCGLNGSEPDEIEVTIFDLVTPTIPADYIRCDVNLPLDNLADGKSTFDLNSITPQVLGTTLDPTLYNVSYHLSQADADANPAANPIDLTTNFINTVANNQTLYVRVEHKGLTTCFATVQLKLVVTPSPVAEFTYSSAEFCQNSTANPSPIVVAPAVLGTFSYVADPPSLSELSLDPTTGEITLSTSDAGDYIVTSAIASANGCPEVKHSVNVRITNPPVATFTYTQSTYCSNGINPSPVFTTGVAGKFTSTAGLIIDENTGIINLSASIPGNYTVTNTIAASGGCAKVEATTDVIITKLPIAQFVYNQIAYCKTDIDPSPLYINGGVAGQFSSNLAGLDINPTTGEITLSSSSPGLYIVTNKILATAGCQEVIETFDITITAPFFADFSYVSTVFCQEPGIASPSFIGTASAGTFTSTSGLIINSTDGKIDLGASSAGSYTVTNTILASGGCPGDVKTFAITITQPASGTFLYNTPLCISTTTPQIPTSNVTASGVYSSAPGLVIDSITGAINSSASTAGNYTVNYDIAPNAGCAAFNTKFDVVITPASAIKIEEGCDLSFYKLKAVPVLNSFDLLTSTFSWTGTGTIPFEVSPTEPNAIILKSPGVYNVTVTTADGCKSTEKISVTDIGCTIQKGISPGADGINSNFDLTGFNVEKIEIFNRYGTEVYSYGAYTNQWHGQASGGEDLPDGTYFYVINRKGGITTTGWIYINRQY